MSVTQLSQNPVFSKVVVDLDGTLLDTADPHVAAVPGMIELIEELAAAGVGVAVLSTRPDVASLLAARGIRLGQVEVVVAEHAADGLRAAAATLGPAAGAMVFVADRGTDVAAGANAGVPTVLVEWGYGSPDEALGAHAVVHSSDQLRAVLLG